MLRFVKPALVAGGVGLILAAAVVGAIRPASAASSTGSVLTTSPVAIDLAASPGSKATTTLQVQNNGTKSVTIDVELEKFKANGESGQAQIYKPSSDDPSVSWVHFSRTSFTADPGVWNSVTMTVELPISAAYGYYYAVLFEPQITTVGSTHNKVKGANAIFVLLNAQVANENNVLQVKSFSSDKSLYQYLPASFSMTTHNSGNIYTAPKGEVFISRTKNGPAIATLDINPGQGNVLPGTSRIFQVTWKDGFPVYQVKRVDGQIVSDKNGKPEQTLHWNGNVSKFRFGKYYARLVLVYSQDGKDVPVTAQVSFWVVPWTVVVILIVILILIVFGIWAVLKDTNKAVRWFRKS